ncbi:MAG TPA: D-glycero-beta-D-manno-heptose 1-phosphate adenylyltransferase [candidate division Zixibacteria bacterium]|nr:D-glycero-beta-D-manno-heptose 1-phosphate adenylyltransferase [candidate division Zixibacteria bacterium]
MVQSGLIPYKDIARLCLRLHRLGKRIVFTNGVFDILHAGHVQYLTKARSFGDLLILGLNSDASVQRLKGPKRPLQNQRDRAKILLGLKAVDYVVIFGEDTPQKLIEQVRPDVLVKGADYKISEIVGADFVRANGGTVRRVRLLDGRSSTRLLKLLTE